MDKCKHCGLVKGVHLLGCPNYVPPAKRPSNPLDEILNILKGGNK